MVCPPKKPLSKNSAAYSLICNSLFAGATMAGIHNNHGRIKEICLSGVCRRPVLGVDLVEITLEEITGIGVLGYVLAKITYIATLATIIVTI